jgi:hypothetical protein
MPAVRELVVQRIGVVDSRGNMRIVLACGADDAPILSLHNDAGQPVAMIYEMADGSGAATVSNGHLAGRDNAQMASLSVYQQAPNLMLARGSSTLRLAVDLSGPTMAIRGDDGELNVRGLEP